VIVWSDEATFNFNCAVDHDICVLGLENPHIYVDKMLIHQDGLPCKGLSALFIWKEGLLALYTSTCFGHPFYFSFNSHFNSNKMVHHNTATDMSEATSMKPSQVKG
jgi:hypothetical protein